MVKEFYWKADMVRWFYLEMLFLRIFLMYSDGGDDGGYHIDVTSFADDLCNGSQDGSCQV